MTSKDKSGQELAWTLVVKEDRGKLSGALVGGPERPGEIPLLDPKLEGNLFTFKINVNANCMVETRLKIEGKKLNGTYACAETDGVFTGVKQE